MKKFFQLNKIPLLLLFTAALFYGSFAYDLHRADFLKLAGLYGGLFFVTFKLISIKKNDFWFLAGAAVALRLIFFFALPNLSQDFYRFIWDGRMLLEGWNPYLYLPEEIIAGHNAPFAQAEQLYEGMGELSTGNYTNYPPLNQLIFALAGLLAGKSILGSVVVMRIFIIAADLGILFTGKKLLEKMKLPVHRIFWFVLNPFVIIELTGNLHFEGVMLFFLLLSLYFLYQQKWIKGAIILGLSVLLKLIPLLFLPLFFWFFVDRTGKERTKGFAKLVSFWILVLVTTVSGFLPFLSADFISHFTQSIGLWFQKFEFNASIYYLVRWVGYQVKGYNIIETAGKILPLVVIIFLTGLAFLKRKNSFEHLVAIMLLGISFYFFLSTTVHPWYIATPLLLSLFTRYRFALVWSCVVVLSYYAYGKAGFEENLWLIAVEYFVVLGFFFYEVLPFRKKSPEAVKLSATVSS